MKVVFLWFLSFFLWTVPLCAGSVALVYPLDSNMKAGQALAASVHKDSVFVTAQQTLTSGPTFYVSVLDGELRWGHVLRFDAELNLAELALGDVVDNSVLQSIHHDRSIAYAKLVSTGPIDDVLSKLPTTEKCAFSFEIKINGKIIGDEEVLLPLKRKNSYCDFEIIYQSTVPVKNWTLQLESLPKLTFWKKQRSHDVMDAPRTVFKFNHRSVFTPFSVGDLVKIPLEIYMVNQDFYIWTIKITSGKNQFKKQIKVRFQ